MIKDGKAAAHFDVGSAGNLSQSIFNTSRDLTSLPLNHTEAVVNDSQNPENAELIEEQAHKPLRELQYMLNASS